MTSKRLGFVALCLLALTGAVLFLFLRRREDTVELLCSDAVIAAAVDAGQVSEQELATMLLTHRQGPHWISVRAQADPGSPSAPHVSTLYFDGNVQCGADVFNERGALVRRDRFDMKMGMLRTFYDGDGHVLRTQAVDSADRAQARDSIFVPVQPIRVGY